MSYNADMFGEADRHNAGVLAPHWPASAKVPTSGTVGKCEHSAASDDDEHLRFPERHFVNTHRAYLLS